MKTRLDIAVAQKENISREKAQALIMAGLVFVGDRLSDKPGAYINEEENITVKEVFPYVSRGALKLEEAVRVFEIDLNDKIICDVGASTGGFTDFCLQAGAKKVFAVDTGYGQMAQKLREDPRVILYEKTNIKDVTNLPERIDFFVIDVSFISLTKVLPAIKEIAVSGQKTDKESRSKVVALVKPQFEVGKETADKTKGVIKDQTIQLAMVKKIGDAAEELGFLVLGISESPILGAKGNKEYLIYLSC